jgi:peptidoglycan/LPS O-acetylase OafA/YrhL
MKSYLPDQWSLLAGLRFLLALVVATEHLGTFTNPGALRHIASFGSFEAILGFLLISGYSVGGSCLHQPDGFIKRRLLRVYPIYLSSIVFTIIVSTQLLQQNLPSPFCLIKNLLFLNQITTSSSLVGPAWTLALEVWLYCLCPFMLKTSPLALRTLSWVSFLLFSFYTIGRTLFHWPYYSGIGWGGDLPLLSFAWILGLRIAHPLCDHKKALWDVLVMFSLYTLLHSCIQAVSRIRHHDFASFVGVDLPSELQPAICLGLVWAVFQFFIIPKAGDQSSITLRLLGDISYPLYLLHFAAFTALITIGLKNPYLMTFLAIAGSALVYLVCDGYSRKRHLAISQSQVTP